MSVATRQQGSVVLHLTHHTVYGPKGQGHEHFTKDTRIRLRGADQDMAIVARLYNDDGTLWMGSTVLSVGGKVYQKTSSQNGKTWMLVDQKYGLLQVGICGGDLEEAVLPAKLAALGQATAMQRGAETVIAGVKVREYKLALDWKAMAAEQKGWKNQPERAAGTQKLYAKATLSATVWATDAGLPYKIAFRQEEALPSGTTDEVTEFSSWGAAPAITAPPASTVFQQR